MFYPCDRAIHSLDLSNGKDTVVADFDFEPRCLQTTANVIIGGGLQDLTDIRDTGRDSRLSASPARGLFAVHNRYTGDYYSGELGDFINNAVSLYEDSPTRLRAVVCNNDCSLYFTDIHNSSFEVSESIKLTSPLNHAAVSPDGKMIVACGDTPKLMMLTQGESQGWSLNKVFDSKSDRGFSVAFHPSGVVFGAAFEDGMARLYDTRSLKMPLAEIKTTRPMEMNGAFRCLKFSTGPEDLVFISEQMHRVHIVDLRDFQNHQVLTVPTLLSPPPSSNDNDHDDSPSGPTLSSPALSSSSSPPASSSPSSSAASSAPRPVLQSFEEVMGVAYDAGSEFDRYRVTNGYFDPSTQAYTPAYARYSRYGHDDSGISGLTWSEHDGGCLVVGTDTGVGLWKVDGWGRRTFPAYSIC